MLLPNWTVPWPRFIVPLITQYCSVLRLHTIFMYVQHQLLMKYLKNRQYTHQSPVFSNDGHLRGSALARYVRGFWRSSRLVFVYSRSLPPAPLLSLGGWLNLIIENRSARASRCWQVGWATSHPSWKSRPPEEVSNIACVRVRARREGAAFSNKATITVN